MKCTNSPEKKEIGKVITSIKKEFSERQKKGAVIGLSGGIDSSLVAILAVKALGKEKVIGMILPDKYSDKKDKENALYLSKWLGIKIYVKEISKVVETTGGYKHLPSQLIKNKFFQKGFKLYSKLNKGSLFLDSFKGFRSKLKRQFYAYSCIKNRTRMILLYHYADLNNLLVLGTTNKTEDILGYFVKYGDECGDIKPIAHLFKTQVYELAKVLEAPHSIITRPPSPGSFKWITDKDFLGLDYTKLDRIIKAIEEGFSDSQITKRLKIQKKSISKVREIMKLSVSKKRKN